MKRGTPDHPKVAALASALGLSRPAVLGTLELLWHFTARFCPQGDIGKWADDAIEKACDWTGEPGQLVLELVKTGWIDTHKKFRLVVHDWHDHADPTVRKYLTRSKLSFVAMSRQRPDKVETCLDNVGPTSTSTSTSTKAEPTTPLDPPQSGGGRRKREPVPMADSRWRELFPVELAFDKRFGEVFDAFLAERRKKTRRGYEQESLEVMGRRFARWGLATATLQVERSIGYQGVIEPTAPRRSTPGVGRQSSILADTGQSYDHGIEDLGGD